MNSFHTPPRVLGSSANAIPERSVEEEVVFWLSLLTVPGTSHKQPRDSRHCAQESELLM
jgi:hypothetical protein